MVGKAKRAAIKQRFRILRAQAGKTQDEVTALARLDSGRFWKIENGVLEGTLHERQRIARVLGVSVNDLPSVESGQQVTA